MKKRLLLVFLPFALTSAQEDEAQMAAARQVVENEQKFYQMGQDEGTRAAFLHYLGDDGLVFNPGPVSAKETWSKRPPDGGISLKWWPLFCGVARSADLAYTTGPSEWRRKKEDEKPFAYGQFLSIWKKQSDGAWKVALDVGIQVPGPPPKNEETQLQYELSEAPPSPSGGQAAATKSLREAEASFATAAKADSTIALAEASIPSVRVLREGVFPAVGKEAARLMLSVRRGQLTLERTGGGMSEAGDLGYSYGKYTLALPQNDERGHYLQIWRRQKDGEWKLALDYQKPLPNEQKK
ncbi:MAG TPA: nuclear transport factor 2 family protein [Chthoniobacterales bacterium]|nr:nuclear transport factor 2 family protein [Chthoniobacterales bacterium]